MRVTKVPILLLWEGTVSQSPLPADTGNSREPQATRSAPGQHGGVRPSVLHESGFEVMESGYTVTKTYMYISRGALRGVCVCLYFRRGAESLVVEATGLPCGKKQKQRDYHLVNGRASVPGRLARYACRVTVYDESADEISGELILKLQ